MKKSIYNYIFIILLTLSFNNIYSQSDRVKAKYRELEILERYNNQLEKDRAKEKKAEKIVLSYYYDVKDEIRKKRGQISELEYENIISLQSKIWKTEIKKRLQLYNNYSSFLYAQEKLLKDYRELILDKLYSYLYKSKNNQPKNKGNKENKQTITKPEIKQDYIYKQDVNTKSNFIYKREYLYKSKTYSFAPIYNDKNLKNKLYSVKNEDYIYVIKKEKKGVYKIWYLGAFGFISEGMLKE